MEVGLEVGTVKGGRTLCSASTIISPDGALKKLIENLRR
jgi:hypothetical protein